MDVNKALRELHEEKTKAGCYNSRLGSTSEQRDACPPRRGRKSMSAEERQEVSRRMSKYWEARRAANAPLAADAQESRFEAQSQTRSATVGGSLSA